MMAGAIPAAPAQSLARRLVLGMGVLALAALAIVYAAVMWVSSDAMTRSLAATVDTDLAGLADIHASSGRTELVARLADREELVSIEARRAWYMLVDANGRKIAGNLDRWPPLDPALSEAGYVRVSGVPVYARVTRLSPGLNLLVARDHESDSANLQRLSWTFAAVGLAILLGALAVGHFASRRLLTRIGHITFALQRGDATVIDPSHSGAIRDDEIGLLAKTSSELIARANRLAKMHRDMSDHVAHEVRTPLMHLDNRLVTLQREGFDAAQSAQQLEAARSDIRRIAMLLDSLLDIAANEARRGDPAGLSPVDLSALGAEIADLYQGSMEEAGLTLTTDITPNVELQGEAMQLSRLLSNLLDNAIKYVPRGGQVMLRIAPGPTIWIADDGPGIDAALRPHLFERFRRGAVHSARGGHGLGLALARAICERHGLTITAEDNHPGARFVIQPEAMP
jgi:signal transduction histidine kinase